MLKKSIAWLLTLALCMSIFAGCGNKDVATDVPVDNTVTDDSVVTPTDDTDSDTLIITTAGNVTPEAGVKNVVIEADGVILENADLASVTLSPKLGDGTATLKNVKVQILNANGGGMHSLILDGTEIVKLLADRKEGKLHILVKVGSLVKEFVLDSEVLVDIEGSVDKFVLNDGATDSEVNIFANSHVKEMLIKALAKIKIDAEVDSVSVTGDAKGSEIEITKDGKIEKLKTDVPVNTSGEGAIDELVTDDPDNLNGSVKPGKTTLDGNDNKPSGGKTNPGKKPATSATPTAAPTATPTQTPSKPGPDPVVPPADNLDVTGMDIAKDGKTITLTFDEAINGSVGLIARHYAITGTNTSAAVQGMPESVAVNGNVAILTLKTGIVSQAEQSSVTVTVSEIKNATDTKVLGVNSATRQVSGNGTALTSTVLSVNTTAKTITAGTMALTTDTTVSELLAALKAPTGATMAVGTKKGTEKLVGTDKVKVTAQNGTTTAEYAITLAAAKTATSVTFAKGVGAQTVVFGDTLTNVATGTDGVAGAIAYSSDNTAAATVSDKGVITTVGIGTAKITATFTPTADTHMTSTASYKVNVARQDLKAATVGALTYTGFPQTAVYTVKDKADKTVDAKNYNVDEPTIKNAATYSVPITGIGNYQGTISAEFTVAKADITVATATVQAKPYDNSANAVISAVTFTGLMGTEKLAQTTDFIVSKATYADANVGADKAVTLTVTLNDTAIAKNYNLTNGTDFATKGEITAIAVTNTAKADKASVDYAAAGIDLSTLFNIDTNAGDATYTATAAAANGGTVTAVTGNILTISKCGDFTIKMTTAAKGNYAAGTAVTVTLTVKKAANATVPAATQAAGTKAGEVELSALTNGTNNYEYVLKAEAVAPTTEEWATATKLSPAGEKATISGITTNKEMYLRLVATDTMDASAAQHLTLAPKPKTAVTATATAVEGSTTITYTLGGTGKFAAASQTDVAKWTVTGATVNSVATADNVATFTTDAIAAGVTITIHMVDDTILNDQFTVPATDVTVDVKGIKTDLTATGTDFKVGGTAEAKTITANLTSIDASTEITAIVGAFAKPAGATVKYTTAGTTCVSADDFAKLVAKTGKATDKDLIWVQSESATVWEKYTVTFSTALKPAAVEYKTAPARVTFGTNATVVGVAPTKSGVTKDDASYTPSFTYKGNNDKVATINASTGVATIVGAGSVTITATATCALYADATASYVVVVDKATLVPADATAIVAKQTYTGKKLEPAVTDWTVKTGNAGRTLRQTADYTVDYTASTGNINAGTGVGKVTITLAADGNYKLASGTTFEKSFDIAKAPLTLVANASEVETEKTYTGEGYTYDVSKLFTLNGVVKGEEATAATITYELKTDPATTGTAILIGSSLNTVTKAGDFVITATVVPGDNYSITTASFDDTLTIAKGASKAAPSSTITSTEGSAIGKTVINGLTAGTSYEYVTDSTETAGSWEYKLGITSETANDIICAGTYIHIREKFDENLYNASEALNLKAVVKQPEKATGTAASTVGSKVITYTLTKGVFDPATATRTTSFKLEGANAAEVGAITKVELNTANTVATITVTNAIAASNKVITVTLALNALKEGFTTPDAATIVITLKTSVAPEVVTGDPAASTAQVKVTSVAGTNAGTTKLTFAVGATPKNELANLEYAIGATGSAPTVWTVCAAEKDNVTATAEQKVFVRAAAVTNVSDVSTAVEATALTIVVRPAPTPQEVAIAKVNAAATTDAAGITIIDLNTATGTTSAKEANIAAYKAAITASTTDSLNTKELIAALVKKVNDKATADADIATAKAVLTKEKLEAAVVAAGADQDAARTAVSTVISGLNLSLAGCTCTIADEKHVASTAGTADNVNGTAGSYKFKVSIAKGTGTTDKTAEMTVVVPAVKYVITSIATTLAITTVPPAKDGVIANATVTKPANLTAGEIAWHEDTATGATPTGPNFAGSKVYVAVFKLTADAHFVIPTDFAPTITGGTVKISGRTATADKNECTVTVTYTQTGA